MLEVLSVEWVDNKYLIIYLSFHRIFWSFAIGIFHRLKIHGNEFLTAMAYLLVMLHWELELSNLIYAVSV